MFSHADIFWFCFRSWMHSGSLEFWRAGTRILALREDSQIDGACGDEPTRGKKIGASFLLLGGAAYASSVRRPLRRAARR